MSGPRSGIGAIVLAGGRSSRFGRDKLAEPIEGRPMLHHAIEAVRAVADDVVVVGPSLGTGGSGDAAGPGRFGAVPPAGLRFVRDRRPFEGPLAGLVTGLSRLDPAVDRALVVAGDMPAMVPTVLARLLEALGTHDAAVLADAEGPRPLPMAIRPRAARPVAQRRLAAGERRLRALISALDAEVIAPGEWQRDDPAGATLRDVDVPADLGPD
jgi:molybdopterin-guanine dinucleotide biosynthesis protein A